MTKIIDGGVKEIPDVIEDQEEVGRIEEQVQEQAQQTTNATDVDVASVVDSVADFMIIDTVVDGIAGIGGVIIEGIGAIIGSMFE